MPSRQRTEFRNSPRGGSHKDRLTNMKSHPTQFGVRENTASSRRHASRLTVDSLPTISMPLEAATVGERGDSVETFSAKPIFITPKELRLVLLQLKPFVA